MPHFLSADIGGTKSLLCLNADGANTAVLKKSYVSAAYTNLADMLDDFLAEAGIRDIDTACLAVAGPVTGRVAKLTNLPWVVDADALATRFKIQVLTLINDFEAVGYGIAALEATDLLTLQTGVEQIDGTRLVVGAGTGLGVAWLHKQNGVIQVYPSEAGHMDFAPTDVIQGLFLRYLRQRHHHVSYERVVSGSGLVTIFEFMRDTGMATPSTALLDAMRVGDAAAAISQYATQGNEEIARMAMNLFLSVYGAFVGNMALAALPRGGIYLAGGIAAKISDKLKDSEFLRAYLSKGRYTGLLATMPMHIVLNQEVGLLGASLLTKRCLL